MKSPLKYRWEAIIVFAIGGLPVSILIGAMISVIPNISISSIIGISVFNYIYFILLGLTMSVALSTCLNRIVTNPVNLNNLAIDQIYWLNGETKARFVNKDEYTGKLSFCIYGYGKNWNYARNARFFLPGEVKEYFSTVQEVFPKEI
jgi:hypothetical protein